MQPDRTLEEIQDSVRKNIARKRKIHKEGQFGCSACKETNWPCSTTMILDMAEAWLDEE